MGIFFVTVKKISNNIRLINSATGDNDIAVIDVLETIGVDWWTGGGFTKDTVLKEFKGRKLSEVHFNISSLGGDYFEALAIKNLAVQTGAKIKVHYFGMVASAATEIGNAAAKEDTTASSDCFILIHNTSTWAGGNKEEIIKTYETLAKFDEGLAKNYAAKSGVKSAEEFAAQMTKDTWMNAEEALEWGLVGKLTAAQPITALERNNFMASAESLKIKTPQLTTSQNDHDMAKKTAKEILNEFFTGIKNAGLKLVADDAAEKPVETEKKVKDLTDLFLKNVEESANGEQQDTAVVNAADYSATVTEAVNSIELDDDATVELPNAPYEVSADGASALAEDLNKGITAKSVSVTYNETDSNLSISVTGCEQKLKTVNGTVEFTESESQASEGGEASNNAKLKQQVDNLRKEKQAIENGKKVEDKERQKLLAEKKALQDELKAIKQGKSGGKSAGNSLEEVEEEEDGTKTNGVGFVRNLFKKQ